MFRGWYISSSKFQTSIRRRKLSTIHLLPIPPRVQWLSSGGRHLLPSSPLATQLYKNSSNLTDMKKYMQWTIFSGSVSFFQNVIQGIWMATRPVAEVPCLLRHFPLANTLHIEPYYILGTISGKNTYWYTVWVLLGWKMARFLFVLLELHTQLDIFGNISIINLPPIIYQ